MLRLSHTVMMAMTLVACGGVPLETAAPSRAAPAPLDPGALDLEPSIFQALLVLDLTPKVTALDEALPEEIDLTGGRAEPPSDEHEAHEDWIPMRDEVALRAHIRRGPLTTRVHESKLIIESELQFGMLARVEPKQRSLRGKTVELRSCGCGGEAWCNEDEAPPLSAKVRFTAAIQLKPDWMLGVEVTPELLDVDACKLGKDAKGKPIDASKELHALIGEHVDGANLALHEALENSHTLERSAQRIWEILARPAPLERQSARALSLAPSAVGFGELFTRDETLLVPVRFRLHPAIVDEESGVEPPPLPHATAIDPEQRGLRVGAVHEIPLERASKLLASKLNGRRFSQRDARYVEIDRASVYGTPDGAAVRLKISGSASGSLYLKGTLRVDAEGRNLFLDDVRFDPASQRAVDELYDLVEEPNLARSKRHWVDSHAIVSAVREAARWPLTDSLQILREDFVRAAERPLMPRTRLAVTIDELSIVDLVIDADAMRVLIQLEGEMENALRPEADAD
jgi:hypothetical protein